MGRRAAPARLSAWARSAALRAVFAFAATALVTLFGALPASGLTARHATAADTAEAGTSAMSAAVATVAPNGALLASSTGSDDADDRGMLLPGADTPRAVRSVGPAVPEPLSAAPARPAASAALSTAWGRAPPA